MNVKTILAILGCAAISVVAVFAITYIVSDFLAIENQVDTFTFERDIALDRGQQLDLADVKATDGTIASELFSATNIGRWGADGKGEDFVGLIVEFRILEDGELIGEPRVLEIPNPARQGDFPERRRLIDEKRQEFAERLEGFASSVSLDLSYGLIVDTTEGVGEILTRRVRESVDSAKSFGNDETLFLVYRIDDSGYQGDRGRHTLADLDEGLAYALTPRPGTKSSSLFEGLYAALREMSGKSSPRVTIFTDGLENTDALSVYRDEGLLAPERWGELDKVIDWTTLSLDGMRIDLYPLPPKGKRHEELSSKGLDYLESRLAEAGADVMRHPF